MRGSWRIRPGLGFKARREREGGTAHEDGQCMARGWPAAWRRVRRAEAEQGRGEEEADGWARARKIKKTSLKFKTEMFPGSKIHQFFTRDR